MKISVAKEELILHPDRAIYWPREKALLIADVHLGKVDHFRNEGLYVPRHAAMDNFERLSSLLLHFSPERLIILGDLFHSKLNRDWMHFSEFRQDFSSVHFDLVLGNHDILAPQILTDNEISTHISLDLAPFSLSHFQEVHDTLYNLSGHVHPGVRLRSSPGHSLRLPCFYFGEEHGILPAFGAFTGTSLIQPRKGDQVVVITDQELIAIPTEA